MPVLSFPCVITHLDPSSDAGAARSHRATWIKGHDLRALAVAATQALDRASIAGACEPAGESTHAYSLLAPDCPEHPLPEVFLVVATTNAFAFVGPMGGPALPSWLPPLHHFPLDELLQQVGLNRGRGDRYMIVVKSTGFWDRIEYPARRRRSESEDAFKARRVEAERSRIEHARREGFHALSYNVPPTEWRAHDLDRLIDLTYRLLPTSEPQWRETGAITQERFADTNDRWSPVLAYCLQVSRGDYTAYLRLPEFPTRALTDWLATRRSSINLHEPVRKLDLIRRGWRWPEPQTVTL